MLSLIDVINKLNYAQSPYYRCSEKDFEPETAHLYRTANNLSGYGNLDGIYVFRTSSYSGQGRLAAQPAVFVVSANSTDHAQEIHRRLWNLGSTPFIIIVLPNQLRIYTGFTYSSASETEGLLDTIEIDRIQQISALLADLSAEAIDSGQIWKSHYAQQLSSNQRVDSTLLKNLDQLGNTLKKYGLNQETAHALIGKYVYIRYLRDREILTDNWLQEHSVEPDQIFSQDADIDSLQKITTALELRFNGKIFPLDFECERNATLENRHISWVASVFNGSQIVETAPEPIHQLHLPFQAYDFRYIPVETLSSIYEQFIDKRKEKGAIYTPEFLADYLLSEVEWAQPLKIGGKVLDPACGSGIFLVLAYRRLIERQALHLKRKLIPPELKNILVESIYGVERERDACYVAEFSLILTLLHYIEPPDLDKLDFKFPDLHNNNIFESDFFDLQGEQSQAQFWNQNLRFDWIVGNPPWASKLNPDEDQFALQWIKDTNHAVSGQRVAEAFSWLVTELLSDGGIVGILLPATSLYNLNSRKFRQAFFTEHDVLRITNFSNLRDYLFGRGKRDVLPAATFIYRTVVDPENRPDIIHYGPFAINQLAKSQNRPWTITINENEIQTVSAQMAITGESSVWKFALWGTYLDKDAIERINFLLTENLSEICKRYKWAFHEGSQLRNINSKSADKLEEIPWLKGKKQFDTKIMGTSVLRHSIEPHVLTNISDEECYIRVQGGKKGLSVTQAPHIIISPAWQHYIVYSDEEFVIPPRQMAIAASNKPLPHTEENLQALTLYLNSSLAAYTLFFYAQEWGIFRHARRVSTSEVGKIRIPNFTHEQASNLAYFQKDMVKYEREQVNSLIRELPNRRQDNLEIEQYPQSAQNLTPAELRALAPQLKTFRVELRQKIDEEIYRLLEIPDDIRLLVDEFINVRLPMDDASTSSNAIRKPNEQELLAYAHELRDELDSFTMGASFHRISITDSDDLVECIVEITNNNEPIPVKINAMPTSSSVNTGRFSELSEALQEQISQWIYVQRGLRLFDGPRIHIYKSPRLIDWTRTQAIYDAGDIIGQVITESTEKE